MFTSLRVVRGAAAACIAATLLAACSSHSVTTSALPHTAAGQQQPPSAPERTSSRSFVTHYFLPHPKGKSADSARRALSQCTSYPCNLNVPVSYGGGTIQHHPHYYLVFWGWHNVAPFDPAGIAPYVQSFAAALPGSSYMNILSQYYGYGQGYIQNDSSEYGGAFWDDGSTPNNPSQNDIYLEALTGMHVFGDQSQDANYIVLTPTGHNQSGAFTNFCGYHSYTTYAPSSSLIFTYIPYMADDPYGQCIDSYYVNGPLDGVSITLGHEIAEAQTDEFPYSGWVDQTNGMQNEVGDKCGGYLQSIPLAGQNYGVQALWSNASMAAQGGNGCVYSYAPAGPPMTCTPDAMGYCTQVTGSSLRNTSCGGDVYQTGSTTYGLYKNGTFVNSYTYTVSVSGTYCIERDTWRPVDPATDVSDPNLI